jgi:hypothetical protein
MLIGILYMIEKPYLSKKGCGALHGDEQISGGAAVAALWPLPRRGERLPVVYAGGLCSR